MDVLLIVSTIPVDVKQHLKKTKKTLQSSGDVKVEVAVPGSPSQSRIKHPLFEEEQADTSETVSYTHLTLPTMAVV